MSALHYLYYMLSDIIIIVKSSCVGCASFMMLVCSVIYRRGFRPTYSAICTV